MSMIPETKVEDSAEFLKNLQRESAKNLALLGQHKKDLQEIKQQITDLKACQKGIDAIKHQYYSLLTEQIELSELGHSEIYMQTLESEIESFTAVKDKGEKPKA